MLELKNVTVSFNDQTILEDISLEVEKGDIIAIIGPSGGGKSTLIRTMNMLVTPKSGEVLFKGEALSKQNINKMRENIGMVFQQFELFPHLTVLKNMILAPVKLKKMDKVTAIEKAKVLLDRVGLLDKINAYPGSLSGGQKQRIAIARALLMNPELMLFDEPTSALDPEMVKEVLDVIRDLASQGMTICIVTHMMGFAREVANKVYFVHDKQVYETSDVDGFFTNPDNDRAKDFLSHINPNN
ncbi:MAG: amino acid ABC transporter ATP-binding protein [Bacilli bacterium]|nr:amino acid ABC transporter ATP-binding protein [Bacilli bacterium]